MAETPISDHCQIGFIAPVSDLDDHRLQPSSLPRVDIADRTNNRPSGRRGTIRSIANERPDLLQVNEALNQTGLAERDAEHAIDEDNQSTHGVGALQSLSRSGSHDPTASRNTTAKSLHREKDSRSRGSSLSDRSTSSPNSVDAFAAPRRRERSGTVISNSPSDLELGLCPTVSLSARSRRPTFSEAKGADINNDAASYPSFSHRSSGLGGRFAFLLPMTTARCTRSTTKNWMSLWPKVRSAHGHRSAVL